MQQYIINLHAFHNFHLLRRALPRSVWAPKRYIELSERTLRHTELTAQLHAIQTKRRAKTKEKRVQNAKEKAANAAENEVEEDIVSGAQDNELAHLEIQEEMEIPSDEEDEQQKILNNINAAKIWNKMSSTLKTQLKQSGKKESRKRKERDK